MLPDKGKLNTEQDSEKEADNDKIDQSDNESQISEYLNTSKNSNISEGWHKGVSQDQEQENAGTKEQENNSASQEATPRTIKRTRKLAPTRAATSNTTNQPLYLAQKMPKSGPTED